MSTTARQTAHPIRLVETHGTTLRAAILRLACELEALEGPWGDEEPYVVQLSYALDIENGPEAHVVTAFVEYPELDIPAAVRPLQQWGIS